MDEFEEESEDETDEEIAPQVQIDGELHGEGAARTEQPAESVEAPHAQEERRETSQHSSYRLSEDSDHHVRLNVGDRRTIAREMRVATAGIGVYVNETTGNTYVRLNGANGRPVGGSQPTVVDVQGSQPPVTQP
ncbi:unnamed protein product [Linum trigynum]|uniref:DUF4115 domain-containing protein n=1 Tax=Linum trigynum TaxID=586398 RepID=A0AAV2GCY9_9ROSI